MRLLLGLTILLASAAPANAATVSVEQENLAILGAPGSDTVVRFAAGNFEANDVRITPVDAATVLVTDAIVPPTPGPGCTSVEPATVRCTAAVFDGAAISLGEGPSRLVVDGALPTNVAGGPSPDRIATGSADDRIRGGGGEDALDAGAGRDVIVDDAASTGDDHMDGGPGRDRISYAYRSDPIRVDLARHRGGGRGEHDRLLRFEDVVGGKDDDRLVGDAGPNRIQGLNGRDSISGRAGRDTLIGGKGGDRLHGGPGRDRLRGKRGADVVRQH